MPLEYLMLLTCQPRILLHALSSIQTIFHVNFEDNYMIEQQLRNKMEIPDVVFLFVLYLHNFEPLDARVVIYLFLKRVYSFIFNSHLKL